MVDDAAKALGPVAGNPVLHEPAVRGAERAHSLAIEPRIAGDRCGETLLQVDQGLAPPVAADRVGELLSVARRTMKVDEDTAYPAPANT